MDPFLGGGAAPRLIVRAQRVARPPTPWAWAIREEGRAGPLRCSNRRYRSAEDAWAVGHALLDRLPKSAVWVAVPAQEDETSAHEPAAG
jgi:hypothetical protein